MNVFNVILIIILCVIVSFLIVQQIQGGYIYELPFKEDDLLQPSHDFDIQEAMESLKEELLTSSIPDFMLFEDYLNHDYEEIVNLDIQNKNIESIYKNYIYSFKRIDQLFNEEYEVRTQFASNMNMRGLAEYRRPEFNNPEVKKIIKTKLKANNVNADEINSIMDLYDEVGKKIIDYPAVIKSLLYIRDEMFKKLEPQNDSPI